MRKLVIVGIVCFLAAADLQACGGRQGGGGGGRMRLFGRRQQGNSGQVQASYTETHSYQMRQSGGVGYTNGGCAAPAPAALLPPPAPVQQAPAK